MDIRNKVFDSRQLSTLPPFLRVLFLADGAFTKDLEAHLLEPIEVNVLWHVEVKAERSYPEIDVRQGIPVIKRCTRLRGGRSGVVYALIESIIVVDRIAQPMRREVISEEVGIGELFHSRRVETYREIRAIRRTKADSFACHLAIDGNADVVIRSYTIYMGGQPAIAIEEIFPERPFEQVFPQLSF